MKTTLKVLKRDNNSNELYPSILISINSVVQKLYTSFSRYVSQVQARCLVRFWKSAKTYTYVRKSLLLHQQVSLQQMLPNRKKC